MGNISQSSKKRAVKEHSTYWEMERQEELKRLKRIKLKKQNFTKE